VGSAASSDLARPSTGGFVSIWSAPYEQPCVVGPVKAMAGLARGMRIWRSLRLAIAVNMVLNVKPRTRSRALDAGLCGALVYSLAHGQDLSRIEPSSVSDAQQ
jgi:hypothetical protein